MVGFRMPTAEEAKRMQPLSKKVMQPVIKTKQDKAETKQSKGPVLPIRGQ